MRNPYCVHEIGFIDLWINSRISIALTRSSSGEGSMFAVCESSSTAPEPNFVLGMWYATD